MSDQDDTPTDLPPHAANVPMIRALGHLTLQLAGLSSNLSSIVRELRVAREPVVGGIVGKVRDAFETLKDIGAAGVEAFTTK